jgi:hypothetical protein
MFFLKPEEFKGCLSDLRVNLDIFAYGPEKNGNSIFFYQDDDFIDKLIWEFDTEENRDKGLEKIDQYTSNPEK